MTFDSIRQTASALGLDYDMLQTARACGCTCFRNGRVYSVGLIAWLRKWTPLVNKSVHWQTPKLNKRLIDRAEAKLVLIERSHETQAVDVLAGLEPRIVGLTAEQAAAVVEDLRSKLP